MVKNITGGCSECGQSIPMAGGSMEGGARRKQFHMLHSQMGVDQRRQNQEISGADTLQQQPKVIGAGMGFRDPSVRQAHRDRARMRSIEDPRFSQWRGNGATMEGGGWFNDAWQKVKEHAPAVTAVVRPHLEKFGNMAGKYAGVDNLGSMADSGLKLLGHGRQGRKRVTKLGRKQLAEAKASGLAYEHNKQWWLNDKPMSVDDLQKHKLNGGGFWGDVWNGIKKVGRAVVAPVGNAVGSYFGVPGVGTVADQGLKLFGVGKRGGKQKAEAESDSDGTSPKAGGRKPKVKRSPMGASDGRMKRNEIVKKVMAEKGLKMIEASKYVKQHNLY